VIEQNRRQIGDEVGAGGVGQNEFNCTILGKIGEGTYDLIFLVRTESPAVTHSKFVGIKKFKQSKDGNDISPTAIREIMVTNSVSNLTFSFPLSMQFFICSFFFVIAVAEEDYTWERR